MLNHIKPHSNHHCLESMQMRRKNLRTQYNFDCRCVACLEDYPPFINLTKAGIPDIVSPIDLQTLNAYTLDCEDLYYKYCEFLRKYDSHYPCVQLSAAQECLKMCFELLMRNVPLALRTKA